MQYVMNWWSMFNLKAINDFSYNFFNFELSSFEPPLSDISIIFVVVFVHESDWMDYIWRSTYTNDECNHWGIDWKRGLSLQEIDSLRFWIELEALTYRVWVFNTIGIFNTFRLVLDIGIFNTFEIFPQTEVLVLNTFIFQVPIPNTFVFQKT